MAAALQKVSEYGFVDAGNLAALGYCFGGTGVWAARAGGQTVLSLAGLPPGALGALADRYAAAWAAANATGAICLFLMGRGDWGGVRAFLAAAPVTALAAASVDGAMDLRAAGICADVYG
eukprot:gene8030-1217_t